LLIDSFNVNSLVKFNHFVFEDATIGTTIIVGEKNGVGRTKYFLMDQNVNNTLVHEIDLPNSKESWDVSMDVVSKSIFIKILQKSKMLGDFVEMSKGMVVKNRNNILTQHPTTNSLPFLLGNCMSKYYYHYDKYAVYGELEIIGGTRDYNKQTITPRLLIRRTGSNLCATYSDKIELVESTIYILRSETLNLKYVLGLLNSKLLTYYLTKKLITNSQGFPQILMGQLEQLPIVVVNDENQSNISSLVDQMLQTQKDSHNAKSEADKKLYEQKISMIDKKIDELVYNLYGLTEEEIRIVEG